MVSILRFWKLSYVVSVKCSSLGFQSFEAQNTDDNKEEEESFVTTVEKKRQQKKEKQCKRKNKEWRCISIDHCFWVVGYVCTTWWLLCFLYNCLPPTLLGFQVQESPGVRLSREGVTALHPVVLVPGIATGGLELWEGRPCAQGLFRKRLWGGSFAEILKRYGCDL